jgi:endonuclease-3
MPSPSAAQKQRAADIIAELKRVYPDAKCALNFSSPLELLVGTILAAQCTDERVNAVTATLFKKYPTAADYAKATQEEMERDVKPTGFYRNKAKNLRAMAQLLVQRHQGQVPQTMAELTALPGAARKTANVVLGNAFGIVEGVVVDTHMLRLAGRWRLTNSADPEQVERDLMALLPKDDWVQASHLAQYHGRAICQARKPLCERCTLVPLCPTGQAQLAAVPTTAAPMASGRRGAKKP